MRFYVYAHFRKTDGRLFYVGKGSGRRAFSRSGRNKHWKSVERKHGFKVRIVKSGLSEDEAFDLERRLISARREQLATYTEGGPGISGYRHTEKAKAAMSKARAGKQMSEVARKHMSETIRSRPDLLELRIRAFQGASNPAKKKEVRDASRERMLTRNPMRDPAAVAKMKASLTGRKSSPETRAKISASLTGKTWGPRSEAGRANIAAAQKKRGKPVKTECGLYFHSTAEAARSTGTWQGAIVNNCVGRCKSAGGYKWSYCVEH